MVDTKSLENEILMDLTAEFCGEETFKQEILAVKVKLAVKELIAKRNYSASTYTEDQILDDLYNYYATISNVARYDYNQLGAEGEKAHSENGVSRTYVDRDELFKGVHAFVKII